MVSAETTGPGTPGAETVGPGTSRAETVSADVGVCTLSDPMLAARLAAEPRVAACAPLATANVGIDQLILGALARPQLRHLVVCGRDSPLFRSGQSLLALAANGCTGDGTIIGATGYRARVQLSASLVDEFRRRVAVHDLVGLRDRDELARRIATLPRPAPDAVPLGAVPPDRVPFGPMPVEPGSVDAVRFSAGGRRVPVASAGQGYFVIRVDRVDRRIVLRHYTEDLRTVHESAGRCAEALLLRVIRRGLLVDLAHAGYLGAELAKAETALRLGLMYVQDRPLARCPDVAAVD